MKQKIALFLFSIILSFNSMWGQNVFNKDYIPAGNNPSIIYSVIATDTDYKCIGVTNYQYIQGLLYFTLNDTGALSTVKNYGETSAAFYDNDGENTVKGSNFLLTTLTMVHYDTTPNVNDFILYFFNDTDTIMSNLLYSDTVACTINSSTILDNYNYSVGFKSYAGLGWDIILIKSDNFGHISWNKHYGGSDIDRGYRIIKTMDNNLIVAARSYGYYTGNNSHYTNDSQWHIYKLDTAGNIIWDKNFGNPDIRDGFPMGLTETSDSNYIITGSYAVAMSGSSELLRGRILKIDRNGNIIWSKLYGNKTEETYIGITKQKQNNNLISILHDGISNIGYFVVIQELTPSGEILWFRKYKYSPDPYGYSVLNSFDFTSDGGYIFAGYGVDYDSVPAQRSWVIKTDSLGFDGVTDFSADTAYRIELSFDTCYNDTGIVVTHIYGITAPYSITYYGYAVHDSLYYSPLYEPYIADTLIITGSMLSGNDSIIAIPCTVTDGLGRVLHDTLTVNVACLVSGVETPAYGNQLLIYPNPANDRLTVEYLLLSVQNNCSIGLYDLKGNLVKFKAVKDNIGVVQFDTSDIPSGTYIISVCVSGSKQYNKQVNIIH